MRCRLSAPNRHFGAICYGLGSVRSRRVAGLSEAIGARSRLFCLAPSTMAAAKATTPDKTKINRGIAIPD